MNIILNKAKLTAVLVLTVVLFPSLGMAQVAPSATPAPTFTLVMDASYFATSEPETAPKEEEIKNPTPEQVKAEIIRQANLYGVSVKDALRVAKCESGYVYNAKNGTSTAKGVFQFINGTWKWIGAEGHQFDYKENIKQFMIWYPKYPQWWECK
jgi:hypothetical protein